ncbi:hypothetical protein PTTG_06645 [Puccinia triticina 1-1 BBBD Race 1]|uniref:RNA-dependent RNA polymerase n=2 Tax=Puccinia triticina TaxID=208348 RepID=A0A180H4M9_PUCT1|nr:uncharacterized protein PtA15_8A722 [Puccinia triticina]OAV99452.1 hypothetical protein PTTG_06645 [Puccinia triticina 1-1 BBBD Race 1]WAQ87815.1 hypothetical protein PtA15_8A722 [Puccinia triticina]WAR57691.1 hypothetical protein PtB15_8B744 [Puccinia triticina]
MEVYVLDLPSSGTHLETKLALITAISKVIHRPPVLKSDETKSNFQVDVRPLGNPHSQHPQPAFLASINRSDRLTATVTFPTSELGHRFLTAVVRSPIKIFNNLSPIQFEQSLRNGRRIIPHPQLIKALKDSRFKETTEVIQELKELELTQKPIPISLIDFGRTCLHLNKPAFSSEYAICLPSDSSQLRFDIDNKFIMLSWTNQERSKKIVIQLQTLRKIEACSPWVILSLARPPQFEELLNKIPSFLSGPASAQDKNDAGLRIRVHGYSHTRADAFPFVNNQLRIQFATDAAFRNFCSLKISVPLPKITSFSRTIVEKDHYDPERIKSILENLVCFTIPVAFQIECLLHNSVLLPYQILRVCQALMGIDESLAERALIQFIDNYSDSSDGKQTGQKPAYLQALQEALKTSAQEATLHHPNIDGGDSFPCRTVTITPTRLSLQGPHIEQSNSILRLYGQTHNFVRVSLADETGHRLRSSRDVDIHHLLRTRYRPFLTKGMILCGRKFEFLGYSNSALKDHQAWFVCPFYKGNELVTAASIRAKLGDFSKVIRIPARYMARIAQAFTSTRKSLTLRPSEVTRMADVERNDSCFTDGVGTISQELVDEVHRVLNIGNIRKSVRSTCYQIRLGGFKGMLSLDPTLKGKVVRMRPSMDKFDAPDSLTLDIAGTFTKPLVAYLNRPLIKLLEDLGIRAEVFLKLQAKIVRKVEDSRKSPKLAADLMQQYSLGSGSGMASILHKLSELLGDEVSVGSDFVEECYDLMTIQCLRDLKYRGRIPLEKSYTLVGVADEDNFLPPDSIYVCVQYPQGAPKYLKGSFAVTRSPSLHPGDVRVVTAVGKLDPKIAPRLSSLVNCVAFPVQGSRSLPSCLGGGDLDGDLFTVIGLPELVPNRARIQRPASYLPPEMRKLDRDCTIADGADFFLDYISSDLVGMIATRHLHIADQCAEGTLNGACLRLAELHSDAVDYPKTGVPVNIRQLPNPPAKMKPDFMCHEHDSGKEGEDYYESGKVLGKLFREIPADKIDIFIQASHIDDDIAEMHRFRRTDRQFGGVYARLDGDSRLHRLVVRRIKRKYADGQAYRRVVRLDERLRDEFTGLLAWFGSELMKICKLNSVSTRTGGHHLTESEAFLGVIVMPCERFEKRAALSGLLEQTTALFGLLRASILGGPGDAESEVDELEEDELGGVHRAFVAWTVATQSQSNLFGTHSFGFISLGLLLSQVLD